MRILLLISMLLLAACQSNPASEDPAAELRQMLVRATDVGAEEYAPIELRFARKKMALIEEAYQKRDRDLAALLLDQALLDAELAIVKSQAARAIEEMNEEGRKLDQLRQQSIELLERQ